MGGWVGRGLSGRVGVCRVVGCGLCGEAPCLPTCPGMAIFLKNVTFHGILLDAIFEENSTVWQEVSVLLKAGIREGIVQPLKRTVFPRTQVEDAFRYMAQGKHIGKVVIQVSGGPWGTLAPALAPACSV